MKKIDFYPGMKLDEAHKLLKKEAVESLEPCYGVFNGKNIYSTDTLDEVYQKVTGESKFENEERLRKEREEYERKKAQHEAAIPELTKKYREAARGVILEAQYDLWDKIVPVRLRDLYEGMELDCTLDLCRIMRDDTLSYGARLRKAYKEFMGQGHSGMSASLVSSMLRKFCPDGVELADAVMSFRYKKEGL